MSVFARIVVGGDGTDWGFDALRQALVLAPKENPVLHAVTALDTAPTVRAGFHAAHFAELLVKEAEEARDAAETIKVISSVRSRTASRSRTSRYMRPSRSTPFPSSSTSTPCDGPGASLIKTTGLLRESRACAR
jgi:hypothetical protein